MVTTDVFSDKKSLRTSPETKHFLQIHGRAIVSKMAPSYANLWSKCIHTCSSQISHMVTLHRWHLHDMDIFLLQDLNSFTTYLDGIHPTIKLTCNRSFISIPLEVNVSIIESTSKSSLTFLQNIKHQYLLHYSCQPRHTKRAIPFSLVLRHRWICSSDETFTLRTTNSWHTFANMVTTDILSDKKSLA